MKEIRRAPLQPVAALAPAPHPPYKVSAVLLASPGKGYKIQWLADKAEVVSRLQV